MDIIKYDRSGIHTYNYYTTLDAFMKSNPPCKECLIQSMCIINKTSRYYDKLEINSCNRLNEFSLNNYWFH
jgi:hypothetical protein